jgi:GWxTD domain-containing protein
MPYYLEHGSQYRQDALGKTIKNALNRFALNSFAFLSVCTFSLLWFSSAGKYETELSGVNAALPLFQQHSRSDSLKTEKQYLTALRAADEITFPNEFEKEFLLLLDAQQTQEYDSLSSLAARKAYIESYWKASNPNPLLPENDWLLDFLNRRAYARENFPYEKPPYVDDRGKYYLKYGNPRHRYQDPGGFRYVSLFNRAEVYGVVQKFYPSGLAPDHGYEVRANETWAYHNVARDLVIHFIKEGASFREVKSLEKVLVTQQRRNLSWQYSDLIKQRAAISPALGILGAKIEEFESGFIAIAYGASPGLHLADIQNPDERIFEIARKHEFAMSQAFDNAPAAAHDPVHADNRIKFSHTISQFAARQRDAPGNRSVVALPQNLLKILARFK